jgi:hypothetical protein
MGSCVGVQRTAQLGGRLGLDTALGSTTVLFPARSGDPRKKTRTSGAQDDRIAEQAQEKDSTDGGVEGVGLRYSKGDGSPASDTRERVEREAESVGGRQAESAASRR